MKCIKIEYVGLGHHMVSVSTLQITANLGFNHSRAKNPETGQIGLKPIRTAVKHIKIEYVGLGHHMVSFSALPITANLGFHHGRSKNPKTGKIELNPLLDSCELNQN